MHRKPARNLEPVVQLTHKGQLFTFRADRDSPPSFWRVESEGRIYGSPAEVSGNEQPEFFRMLADTALREWG